DAFATCARYVKFIVGNEFFCRSQKLCMLQIKRCERGDGSKDRARRIVTPADASFPGHAIDLLVEEPAYRNTEQQLESTQGIPFGAELLIELQHIVYVLIERFMSYLYAVDLKSLGDVHQMRRDKAANLTEFGLQQ